MEPWLSLRRMVRDRFAGRRSGSSQFTTPVAHEGYLYGVHGTGGTEIVCYDIESGEKCGDGIDLENARLGRASLLHVDGAFSLSGPRDAGWLDLSPEGANIRSQTQLFGLQKPGRCSHGEQRPAIRASKRYGFAFDLLI